MQWHIITLRTLGYNETLRKYNVDSLFPTLTWTRVTIAKITLDITAFAFASSILGNRVRAGPCSLSGPSATGHRTGTPHGPRGPLAINCIKEKQELCYPLKTIRLNPGLIRPADVLTDNDSF